MRPKPEICVYVKTMISVKSKAEKTLQVSLPILAMQTSVKPIPYLATYLHPNLFVIISFEGTLFEHLHGVQVKIVFTSAFTAKGPKWLSKLTRMQNFQENPGCPLA